MRPIHPTPEQVRGWQIADEGPATVEVFGGPEEGEGVIPCPAVVTAAGPDRLTTIHVAYQLDEIEVARLAQGGTLWLSCFGGLPVHLLSVEQPR